MNSYITTGYLLMVYGTFVMPFFVNELRLNKMSSYRSKSELRKNCDALIKEYRAMQILQKMYNNLFGQFLVPFQSVITLTFVFGSFIVIKHRNDDTMHIFPFLLMASWSIVAPACWSFMLLIGGYLHSNGMKVLSSWKYHRGWKSCLERKLMKKCQASCKPVTINYGKAYVIRKVSVLEFNKGLIRGLARALLTLYGDY